jgi:Flp pilus assembly protein TadB
MSKERARRRAEREREAAVLAAARAAEAERRERREARRHALTGRLPRSAARRGRPGGVLAQRRRRENGALLAALLAVNVLVWVVSGDWALRLAALVVSLLAAPVLHTMLFRRSTR